MPDPDANPERRDPSATVPERARSGSATRTAVLAVGGGLVLFAVGALALDTGLLHRQPSTPAPIAPAPQLKKANFVPPPESAIPEGPAGESIRRGMAIFMNPGANAREHVGNKMACTNCHLDGGRQANAAPMWAAWVAYPAYRSKNKKINTMEDRVRGCFNYSMNAQDSPSGKAPPAGDQIYKDLEMYFYWLATGAPTGAKMPGKGYLKLEKTALGHDPKRGAQVFSQNCASCHGADGQGQTDANGRVVFPPLWGPHSFNWGAGMASISSAAGFIKANMPLGQGYSLTDQQAWDVAAFVDSHERPRDPRQTGTVAEAQKEFHAKGDYYGKTIDGHVLGAGSPRVKITS